MPLFYPSEQEELRQMFVVMAKKMGAQLAAADVPEVPHKGHLSGADIEGMVGRAWRMAQLAGEERLTRERLTEVINGFIPSNDTFVVVPA